MPKTQTPGPAPNPFSPPPASLPVPGFQPVPPATTPGPDPLPDGAVSGSAPGSSEPPTHTPTDDRPPGPISKTKAATYTAIARGALRAFGGMVNMRLAVDDEDDSWLPDDEDEETVPPPVGRLMARRMPFDAGSENLTELEDLTVAAIGLIGYGLKSVTSMWENRRRHRRGRHRGADGATVATGLQEGDEQ